MFNDIENVRVLKNIQKKLKKKFKLRNNHSYGRLFANFLYLGYFEEKYADMYMTKRFNYLLQNIADKFKELECNYTEFKIEYDKGIIGNDGTRGCFVGVKIKNSNDDEEDLIINKLYPALDTKEKDNEIKLLKQKLEELEFLLKDKDEEIKRLSKPKEEIKQVITAEIKEEIINDNEEK
jgi:hypothetical protein